MPDTTSLYTTYRNTSGVTRYFGYIGARGTTLAPNAEVNIFGRPESQRRWNVRKQAGLEADLLAGRVQIMDVPDDVLRDASALVVANPSVAATVVTSGGSVSSLPAGTYFAGYSFVTANGESLMGGVSAAFTLAAGPNNAPIITLPALPTGVTSMNLYLSNTNGAANALKKYSTGITTTTTSLVSALWNAGTQAFAAAPAPPLVATSGGHINRITKVINNVLSLGDPSWGYIGN